MAFFSFARVRTRNKLNDFLDIGYNQNKYLLTGHHVMKQLESPLKNSLLGQLVARTFISVFHFLPYGDPFR